MIVGVGSLVFHRPLLLPPTARQKRTSGQGARGMARDDGASPVATAERRRVALRMLLARGEASSSSPTPKPEEVRRNRQGLGSSAALLRGLGCTSAAASQAHAPVSAAAEVVRPLGEWHGRRRRKGKAKERRNARGVGSGLAVAGGGIAGDVWCTCTPGIPFAAEASSVDCVVARHQPVGTGRRGEAERRHRERNSADPRTRRVTMREHISSSTMDSPPRLDMPFLDAADLVPPGRHRHMGGFRHSHAGTEEEIMMFRTRLLLGRMGMYDQYQDWRLDVDNMNYEELLALEDKIGYVSTGLREDEIVRGLRMVKHSAFNSKHFSTEMGRNCSICQEEFEASDELGRLNCGHGYHVHCIKQWLSRKNACPVCKIAVSRT